MKEFLLLFLIVWSVEGRSRLNRREKEEEPKISASQETLDRSDGAAMDTIFEANKYLKGTGVKLFEGDIEKSKEMVKLVKGMERKLKEAKTDAEKREAKLGRRWKDKTIPYQIKGLPAKAQAAINDAIKDFTDSTCLKWRRRRSNDRAWVTFQPGIGCYTQVGAPPFGGERIIVLGGGICYEKKSVIHEMMHASGFFHEQSRRDRNNFIFVNYTNMLTDKDTRDQFKIYQEGEAETYDAGYDKQSVMHYGRYQPSVAIDNKYPVMQSLSDPDEPLGNRNGFSQTDIDQINAFYNCNGQRREENPLPECKWQLEHLSDFPYSLELGTIAGPQDCIEKCWRAKNLKFYFKGSTNEKIDGAQLISPSTGVYTCKCLISDKGEIHPKSAFGNHIDQMTHYRVCKYGSKPAPNPTNPGGRPRPPTTTPPPTTQPTPSPGDQINVRGRSPIVYFKGRRLSCYNAVASRKYAFKVTSSSLTNCVKTCDQQRKFWINTVTGASFVQERTGSYCYCTANRSWKRGRQQGSTCFFQGVADEPVPAPPPPFNAANIKCHRGKRFQWTENMKFGTDASGDSPIKCAQRCHVAKTEGGYFRDTSGLKGSEYVETNGRFSGCYCSFLSYYLPETMFSTDRQKSHTVCIL